MAGATAPGEDTSSITSPPARLAAQAENPNSLQSRKSGTWHIIVDAAKLKSAAQELFCVGESPSCDENPHVPPSWGSIMQRLKMKCSAICSYQDQLSSEAGCFCTMKTYRTQGEVYEKLRALGCISVEPLHSKDVKTHARFVSMVRRNAVTVEFGFEQDLQRAQQQMLRPLQPLPPSSGPNHNGGRKNKGSAEKQLTASSSPCFSSPLHAQPCIATVLGTLTPTGQRMLDKGECRASSSSSMSSSMSRMTLSGEEGTRELCPAEEGPVAQAAPTAAAYADSNAHEQGDQCMVDLSASHHGLSGSQGSQQPMPIHVQALQVLLADENSHDSFSSAARAQSSSGGSRDGDAALQAALKRIQSYKSMYRRKDKDLAKAERLLNETEGELQSMRKELSVAKSKMGEVKGDLLRLVGDIYRVSSSSVTVQDFRRSNMVCTNYRSKAESRADSENVGTHNRKKLPKNSCRDGGEDASDEKSRKRKKESLGATPYMDGLYAMPRSAQVSAASMGRLGKTSSKPSAMGFR